MKRLPTHVAMGYAQRRGWIDVPGGLAMMRDRAVPVAHKMSSLGLGFLAMLVLQALELPLEGIAEVLTGGLATPLLAVVEGLEWLILPVLFGAAILSRRAASVVPAPVRR